MVDIPSDVLRDMQLVQLPTRDRLAKIYEEAASLAALELKIADAEAELRRLKDDARKIKTDNLPKLFDEVGVDTLGVPGFNADVVVKSMIHAAIKADWPEDKQEEGFAELDRLGGGDIVKFTVSVSFGRGEAEEAARLVRVLRGTNWLLGREVRVKKEAHWATLTKFVSEMAERLVPMDLAKMGGTITRAAEIVWRKK